MLRQRTSLMRKPIYRYLTRSLLPPLFNLRSCYKRSLQNSVRRRLLNPMTTSEVLSRNGRSWQSGICTRKGKLAAAEPLKDTIRYSTTKLRYSGMNYASTLLGDNVKGY